MYTRTVTNILILLFLLGGIEALAKPQHPVAQNLNSALSVYNSLIYSDFDSDNKVDRAELTSDGPLKRVYVTLGKSSWKLLSFDSGVSDRGRLLSGDIDNDGDADLIWVSQSYPQKLVMWLGDGRGNFSLAPEADADLLSIQTLLGNLCEGSIDRSKGHELLCILINTSSPGLPSVARQLFYVSSTRPVLSSQKHPIPSSFRAVLKQRGPPKLI